MVDAINIRKNEKELVPFPERQPDFKAEDSLAAYAISETFGNKITIQAKFERTDSKIKSIEVRAIDPASNDLLSEVENWMEALFSWLVPPSTKTTRKRADLVVNELRDFFLFEGNDISNILWHLFVALKVHRRNSASMRCRMQVSRVSKHIRQGHE